MRIMAIDPGDVESGYVIMDGYKPLEQGKLKNEEILSRISKMEWQIDAPAVLAIEMVASYGMAVGRNVFDTCVWIGRFWQKYLNEVGGRVELIYRMEEKITLCHDSKAKDTNIRQALIDRFADHDKERGKGTKKDPDWFYGFSKDAWMAYAVGVVLLDKEQGKILKR